MIIKCDECQAKFKLDDSKISDKGAKVRCSKCKHVFTVYKAPVASPVEAPVAPPVEAPVAPPVEEESFGMDIPDGDDLFGLEDDSFDSSLEDKEESNSETSAESGDEELSWGGLAGDLDDMNIEFEDPEADKSIEDDVAGFGLEGEGDVAADTAVSDGQSDNDFADQDQELDLDLDTGPDLSEGLDVTDSPDNKLSDAQDTLNHATPEDISDEEFEGTADNKPETTTKIKTEKSSSKLLVFLLALALTLGGSYYIVISKLDVVIAGYDIGQMLRSSAASFGISSEPKSLEKIEISDLNGYYLQSEKDGLIFIVEGFASNNFSGPRSFISIKGTLYDGSGKSVMEETAFCGNTFTKDELATLSRKKVTLDLQSKLGKGLINSNIPPGKKIPFMLVFYSTPDNLAEFNVVATGSEDATHNAE